jgi:hypothetical protein
MADEFYSTIQDVIEDTGIEPSDFDFEDDEDIENGLTAVQKLENKVQTWLIESKDMLDAEASVISNRERDFHQELKDGTITKIPICIHDIAKRIAINKVKQARVNRDTSIVSKDDYAIVISSDNILTNSITKDLKSCILGRSKKKKQSGLTLFRVDTSCD